MGPTPRTTRTDDRCGSASVQGLFDIAGASAAREVEDAAAEQRDLSSALRRSYTRQLNYQAAALSEPLTAAALQPLADQGWRVMHDRRWPGSTQANVDHLVIGHGGVAVIDTKHWSQPVQVRDGRLWCGDDDRHDDTVDTILRLTASIEELLEEVATSSPGRAVGLSPIHVVPVLVFTGHPTPTGPTRESGACCCPPSVPCRRCSRGAPACSMTRRSRSSGSTSPARCPPQWPRTRSPDRLGVGSVSRFGPAPPHRPPPRRRRPTSSSMSPSSPATSPRPRLGRCRTGWVSCTHPKPG